MTKVPRNLTRIEKLLIPEVPAAPIRPSLAYACLQSVPLRKETALAQLDFLRPLFEWQSTVDYLEDPPKGYLSEGVDLIGGLDEIAAKLDRGYQSEFEFLADLYTLTSVRVRDNHFVYNTLLMDIFTFELGVQFISISKDGVLKPEVYLYDDVHHDKRGYTPSSVSTIDGIPAHAFLQKASVKVGSNHDPDARFNKLLPSVANDGALAHLAANPFTLDLPDTTTVKCRNGTKLVFKNTAWFRANFTNISSGADLYQQFGQANGTAPKPDLWETYQYVDMNFTSPLEGYPVPLSRTTSGSVAGFLFNDDESRQVLSDTAVLSVNSFYRLANPSDPASIDPSHGFKEFDKITAEVLHAAKASNKTKLILDLQGNGGGHFYHLNSLYLSFFPNKAETLPMLYQLRAHPQLEWYGAELFNASNPTRLPIGLETTFVKPGSDPSTSNGTLWSSFEEFYGPVQGAGGRGEYTHGSTQASYNSMHNPGWWDYTQPFAEPPFQPQDIVLVTDGECGSACAIFVDILVNVHGVRTVAMGGRPIEAPMQAIGEVKGGPLSGFWGWPEVDRSRVPEGLEIVPSLTNSTPPLRISGIDLDTVGWGGGVHFNLANMVPFNSPNDGDGAMPYQFLYEAANCKLFFTWEMARDIVALWKAVAEVTWHGAKCVKGSTTRKDGRMGGRPEHTEAVEDQYQLGPGPGALKK